MPKLQVKGRRGSRQIRIGDGGWLPIDEHIESEAAKLPFEIHTVALLLAGPYSDVRLHVLRTIARERGWTVSGEFVEDGVSPGLSYKEFLDHARSLQCDAALAWGTQTEASRRMPPQLQPNIFKVPRDQWKNYLPWSGCHF